MSRLAALLLVLAIGRFGPADAQVRLPATGGAPIANPNVSTPNVAIPGVSNPGVTIPDAAIPALAIPNVAIPKSAASPQDTERHRSQLALSVLLTPRDPQPVAGKVPVHWKVFAEAVDAQGKHALVAQSTEAAPILALVDGTYIVHVALDLASAVRRVTVAGAASSERLVLNAGALRIVGMLGDKPINPAKLAISIYVPEAGNSEAKLVLAGAKAGDLVALPEGSYHVVSTLLDTAGYSGAPKSGVGNKTNSVVTADLKVQPGKLTDATLRHRSAVMTLKLVNDPGGEALANTAFTILTPGGDVIRELIGAFPSLVLAEGEYVAIARHDAKTFQTTFKVSSTLDRDVEVLAK